MPPELQRIVRLTSFADEERTRPALRYWLSRPPAERVAAVEYLRRQVDGSGARLRRVIGFLTAHGVEFVVVGAYALAFHGAPRFTGDLDILVRPTLDNAARLLTALDAFGFPVRNLSPETIVDRRRMLQMGVPPVQIHVMSAITGVEWGEAWTDRVEGPLGSHRVHFIGRETFLRNKRAAGRPKDLADIDALEPGQDV